jgi:hypothetical protein
VVVEPAVHLFVIMVIFVAHRSSRSRSFVRISFIPR